MCIMAIMLNNTTTAFHLQKFKNKALIMCRSVRHMALICDSLPIDERHYEPCESNEQCSYGKFCLNNACEKGFPTESQEYNQGPWIYTREDESENTNDQPINIDQNPFLNIMPNKIKDQINSRIDHFVNNIKPEP